MAVPLINGKAYDFALITVVALGVPLPSVSDINYTEEQEKENNFGLGNRPVSRGQGAINASGSLDISMNDIEALRDVAPNGSLLQVPAFDIVVVYGNPQKPVTNVLKNCEFIDDGVETTQNHKDVKRTFGLVISHVKYR
jgi:hypothetical protein